MKLIEEENILIESKEFKFVFSRDYINEGLFVDIYDNKKKELIVKDHEIKKNSNKRVIMEKINKKPGTIIRQGKMKFLVRNHDKCMWHDNKQIAGNYSSINSVYDTRNTQNISLLSRIIPNLKLWWIKI